MSQSKLQSVFAKALGIPITTQFETLKYQSIPEWDSIAHMQLVSALEGAFDVMLETDDVIDMNSFQKAREILGRHGVQF